MQTEEVVRKAWENLMKAFEETLLVLGESVRDELHSLLERVRSIRLNQFPTDWKAVSDSFEEIFGAGTQTFESFIVRHMVRRLEVKVDLSLDFESAIQKMDFQLRKRIGLN